MKLLSYVVEVWVVGKIFRLIYACANIYVWFHNFISYYIRSLVKPSLYKYCGITLVFEDKSSLKWVKI